MLSRQSIDNLLDLVEIKLGCMQVLDRDDARELAHLEACRRELLGLMAERKGSKRVRFTPKDTPTEPAERPLPH